MIKNLQKIRKAKQYTQKELANLSGLSIDSIKSIENNRMIASIETLLKLANVLQCSTDYLLGLKETEN